MSWGDLHPDLLEVVVCPDCRSSLRPAERPGPQPGDAVLVELVCQGCGLIYPVRDGIPVLLVDEARRST